VGDVIQVSFGPGRQSNELLDERTTALMQTVRQDLDAAQAPEEQRARYRAIARDLMDKIANQRFSVPIKIPARWEASQAEIDAITEAVNEALEALCLRLSIIATETFTGTVQAACASSS